MIIKQGQKRLKICRLNWKKTVIEFQDYNVILKFATIPPVSLLKNNERFSAISSSFSQAQINDEQKILEEDVMNVNSFISSINEMNNTRTVRWDKDIIKIHMKRRGTHQTLKKNFKIYLQGFVWWSSPLYGIGIQMVFCLMPIHYKWR